MDSAGTLFEELEAEAWKDTKADGVTGKYKGEANVRRAARKVWNNAGTNREQLSGPLQAWDACRKRFDKIKKPTLPADARFESIIKQCRELVAREDFQEALSKLIHARTEYAKGQMTRTVDYLRTERDTNDSELMKHRPGYLKIVAECRKRNSTCTKLIPRDLAKVPQDAEALTEYLARFQRAWEAQDDGGKALEAKIRTVRSSKEKDSDKAAAYLDTIRADHLKFVKAVEKTNDKCLETFRSALSTNKAKVVPRSEEDPSVQATFVQHLHDRRKWLNLFRIQLEYSIKFYGRRKGDAAYAKNLTGAQAHQAQTIAEIQKNNTDIRIQTKLLDRARAYQRIHGPDADEKERKRILAGNLKHGWVPVGQQMSGSGGRVQIWIKQDYQGIIIDRIAVKDADGVCGDEDVGDDGKPLEVFCHERLGACEYDETIVKMLNWRMDPERKKKFPNAELNTPYRLYLEYCGRGDLQDLMDEYGCRDYDDQPRLGWIPKPFVWFVLESLAKSASLMKNGTGYLFNDPWIEILHGDIKPANIFLADNNTGDFVHYPLAKLGDLGQAFPDPCHYKGFDANSYDEAGWRPCGTPGFMAPEQESKGTKGKNMWLREQPKSPADVWAIGAVIWSLIKLRNAPDNSNEWRNMKRNEQRTPSDFTAEERAFYGKELCDLAMDCLVFMPKERVDVDDILVDVQRYTKRKSSLDEVFQDKIHGTRDMDATDPKWNKYFVKSRYDKWARGNILEHSLDEADRARIPEDALVPPRKRQRDDSDDEDEDGSTSKRKRLSSEDYGGGRPGQMLKGVVYEGAQAGSGEEAEDTNGEGEANGGEEAVAEEQDDNDNDEDEDEEDDDDENMY